MDRHAARTGTRVKKLSFDAYVDHVLVSDEQDYRMRWTDKNGRAHAGNRSKDAGAAEVGLSAVALGTPNEELAQLDNRTLVPNLHNVQLDNRTLVPNLHNVQLEGKTALVQAIVDARRRMP